MADGSGLYIAEGFDWTQPNYLPVFQRRADLLRKIRAEVEREKKERLEPVCLPQLFSYYREHIPAFINDWGVTVDPRNIERGIPSVVPFLLFEKQVEFIEFVLRMWRERKPGLGEKSRDCGVSWLCVATAASLCLFYDGMAIGFGSRKEEYVDESDNPKSLFWKARQFIRYLPREFRGGWHEKRHSAHMRIVFPSTGASMTGEAGDNIGRGDRTAIYIVDESAYLPRPALTEASLSQTTNCRIDVSSVNGMANAFATKRWSGKVEVFIFDWRDDPRKDAAWYAKQEAELDPVVLAQEVDRDYTASVENVVIPNAWVRAAIDAHVKLQIFPTGPRIASLDVADRGGDLNAFCSGQGIVVDWLEEWSGKGEDNDIFRTVERAFLLCDELDIRELRYDGDGLGAGVRGDARIVNERRKSNGSRFVRVSAFRGSAAVVNPKSPVEPQRENRGDSPINENFFANLKAQGWWSLRRRFRNTYRAIEDLKKPESERRPFDRDDLISISSKAPAYLKAVSELSQPTYKPNGAGKIVIDKMPDGAKSPNLADDIMMRFAPMPRGPIVITDNAMDLI